jgi:hypothetical protein
MTIFWCISIYCFCSCILNCLYENKISLYIYYFVYFSSIVYVLNFICITHFYFLNKQLQ